MSEELSSRMSTHSCHGIDLRSLPEIRMKAPANDKGHLHDQGTQPVSRSNEWPKFRVIEGIPVKHVESDIVALAVTVSKPIQEVSKLMIDISAYIPPFRRKSLLELSKVPFRVIDVFQVGRQGFLSLFTVSGPGDLCFGLEEQSSRFRKLSSPRSLPETFDIHCKAGVSRDVNTK